MSNIIDSINDGISHFVSTILEGAKRFASLLGTGILFICLFTLLLFALSLDTLFGSYYE